MERLGIVFALICGACGAPRIAAVGDGSAGETTGTGGADEWGESATTGPTPTTSSGADDASTGASGAEGPKFDLPHLDVGGGGGPPPHEDCPNPVDGTDVAGLGPLGEFKGKWGYFGGYSGEFDWFHLVLFDESADLEAELEFAWESYFDFVDEGPALVVYPGLSKDDIPFVAPADAEHLAAYDGGYLMLTASVESIEQVDVPDPYWVMTGSIAPWPDEQNADFPLGGEFKAVYCSAFDENVIAE